VLGLPALGKEGKPEGAGEGFGGTIRTSLKTSFGLRVCINGRKTKKGIQKLYLWG